MGLGPSSLASMPGYTTREQTDQRGSQRECSNYCFPAWCSLNAFRKNTHQIDGALHEHQQFDWFSKKPLPFRYDYQARWRRTLRLFVFPWNSIQYPLQSVHFKILKKSKNHKNPFSKNQYTRSSCTVRAYRPMPKRNCLIALPTLRSAKHETRTKSVSTEGNHHFTRFGRGRRCS